MLNLNEIFSFNQSKLETKTIWVYIIIMINNFFSAIWNWSKSLGIQNLILKFKSKEIWSNEIVAIYFEEKKAKKIF